MKEKEVKTYSGKIIYDALQKRNLEVEQLADRLNLSSVAIYHWLNGKRIISFHNVPLICQLLRIGEPDMIEAIKKDKMNAYERKIKSKPKPQEKSLSAHIDIKSDMSLDLQKLKVIEIPILGSVPAGPLQEIIPKMRHEAEGKLYKSLNGIVNPDLVFALRVKGESMIGRKLDDGDIIIVDAGAQYGNGNMVVAMVNNEATVKTLLMADSVVILQSENPKIEPIIIKNNDYDNVRIVGKVIKIEKEP